MPFALVVESGAGMATANALASQQQVTDVLDASPFNAALWTAVTPSTRKDQCIAEASALLSRLRWKGLATTEGQALAWPRAWMETPDGYAIASNAIPAFLVRATAKLAFWLSQQSESPFEATGLMPGTELALPGGLRLTPASGSGVPSDVLAEVAPYLDELDTVGLM